MDRAGRAAGGFMNVWRVGAALWLLSLLTVFYPAAARSADAVVVTGSAEPIAVDRLVAGVVRIDRATIEATTADSVADLLRRESGVQPSRNGGQGQSTGVMIRGTASVNTVVLVDGVRVGSATLGYAALEGLSLSNVEYIEVLRGYDDRSASGDITTGSLGGSVQLAHGLRLRALAGTTFRAPRFNELHYPGYSVATLQPEHWRSIEFGLSWAVGANVAEATLYRNRVRNMIGCEGNPGMCPAGFAYSSG